MKNILLTLVFLISAASFSQNEGLLSGRIIDSEAINEPLIFAKITVKETGTELLTDRNGFFKFDNLKGGTYTLVCSFVGYESKELKAEVISNQNTTVKLALAPTSLSLDDLMFALSSADANTSANNIISQ